MKQLALILSLLFISSPVLALAGKGNPVVIMKTNKGEVELELFQDKAPLTVKNFLQYVNSKFYDGTIFHRVIGDFMIQGGGYTTNLEKKKTREPIVNEAHNKLGNEEGTLAMARTSDVNSATAQFFINVKNNSFLNHRSRTQDGYGYAVFGRVKKGMPVINTIKKVATVKNGPFQNLPAENIIIESMRVK